MFKQSKTLCFCDMLFPVELFKVCYSPAFFTSYSYASMSANYQSCLSSSHPFCFCAYYLQSVAFRVFL